MRPNFMFAFFSATFFVSWATASTIHLRKDGDDGNGITTVADLKNPACRNWYAARDAILGGLFHGICNDLARAAIRLSFHDAGTFSLKLQSQGQHSGGADASIILDPTEVERAENNGLQAIVQALAPLAAQFSVSNADIVQVAGVLGVVACPGGPVIEPLVGRKDATAPAPLNHIPDTRDTIPNTVNLFADMGLSAREFMALIGSHSTARSRFVDLTQANKSMDSTIDIWDVRFYSETQNAPVPSGVFKLPGDVAASHHQLTSKDFNRFVGKQDNWAQEYGRAHLKMSQLGVNETLTDCSEIMPAAIDLSTVSVSSGSSGSGSSGSGSSGSGSSGSGNSGSGSGQAEPVIDRTKLAAAIQKYRAIWLV